MDIEHRVGFNSIEDAEFMSVVIELGIVYQETGLPGGRNKLVTFVVTESNPQWAKISELITTMGAVNIVETVFTDEEIQKAEWLRLKSTFEQGYPQPKPQWPLKQLSYGIICPKCAIYKQTNPMRLAKEPFLGRKSFLSLIWTGEVFCAPEVFQGLELIQAKGYEAWDAVIHKTGKPSERLYQLYIPAVTSPGVIIDNDLKRKICPNCGTIKYYPHVKGKMHLKRDALLPDSDFLLTNEWFGHGLLAWREILVSSRVARLVLDKGWQGVRFKVVELV